MGGIELQKIEMVVLDQVKFLNFILKEIRKRNKELKEELGMSYAKFIGQATPFEEMICISRKVKGEFDGYLKIVREEMRKDYEHMLGSIGRKKS